MESDILPISTSEQALLDRLSPVMREGVLQSRHEARDIVAVARLGSRAAVALIVLDISGAGLPAWPARAAEIYEANLGIMWGLSPLLRTAPDRLPTRGELVHLLACESAEVRSYALRIAGQVLAGG